MKLGLNKNKTTNIVLTIFLCFVGIGFGIAYYYKFYLPPANIKTKPLYQSYTEIKTEEYTEETNEYSEGFTGYPKYEVIKVNKDGTFNIMLTGWEETFTVKPLGTKIINTDINTLRNYYYEGSVLYLEFLDGDWFIDENETVIGAYLHDVTGDLIQEQMIKDGIAIPSPMKYDNRYDERFKGVYQIFQKNK